MTSSVKMLPLDGPDPHIASSSEVKSFRSLVLPGMKGNERSRLRMRQPAVSREHERKTLSLLQSHLCLRICFVFCFFFLLFCNFFYLFVLVALGLCCYSWAFSSYSEQGPLFVAVQRLLTAVTSHCRAQALGHAGSAAQLVGPRVWTQCSMARGTFLDQGLNLCPLRWQVDS